MQEKLNKKIIFIIIGIVVAIIIIFICLNMFDQRTLTCTKSENFFGIETNTEINIRFDGEKIKLAEGITTIDLSTKEETKDEYVKSLEEVYSKFRNENVSVDVTSDSEYAYIRYESKSDMQIFDISDSSSYIEAKEELQIEGFTCK